MTEVGGSLFTTPTVLYIISLWMMEVSCGELFHHIVIPRITTEFFMRYESTPSVVLEQKEEATSHLLLLLC